MHLAPRDKHIRDLLKDTNLTAEQRRTLNLFKFGKRVVFDPAKPTKEILTEHLKEIHEHCEE